MPRKAAKVDERESVSAPTKRVRRTPVRKTVSSTTETVVSSRPRRKAPMRTPSNKMVSSHRHLSRTAVAMGILFCMVGGASVAVGMQDSGRIDVGAMIEHRNTEATAQAGDGEVVERISIPKHDVAANVPNGGLRGKGSDGTPTPEVLAAETASSSTDTATTSDSVVSEEEVIESTDTESVAPTPTETPS